MTITINSQEELYNKIKPALRCKKHELINEGITIVSENEIWEYHKRYSWIKGENLTLAEVVDDILNTPGYVYQSYILNKLNNKEDVI